MTEPEPTPVDDLDAFLMSSLLAGSVCPYGNGDHGPLIRQARDEERARIYAAIKAEMLHAVGYIEGTHNDGLRLAAWIARHSHEEGL